MENLYTRLSRVRSKLGVSTSEDAELLELIESGSREADRVVGLLPLGFWSKGGSRYYEGDGTRLLFIDPLISVTSIKLDEDGDGVFEVTLSASDYILHPLNAWPKESILMDDDSSYTWPEGKSVEIVGVHGFAESDSPWKTSGITLGENIDDEVTTIPVSAEGTVEPGQTIRIGTEQMMVTSVTSDESNEITVDREVNGSTAASHTSGDAISVAVYPRLIDQFVYEWSMDRFQAGASVGMSSERLGDYNYTRSAVTENMMNRMLEHYRKTKIRGV